MARRWDKPCIGTALSRRGPAAKLGASPPRHESYAARFQAAAQRRADPHLARVRAARAGRPGFSDLQSGLLQPRRVGMGRVLASGAAGGAGVAALWTLARVPVPSA